MDYTPVIKRRATVQRLVMLIQIDEKSNLRTERLAYTVQGCTIVMRNVGN
jgi:hypothetical protein